MIKKVNPFVIALLYPAQYRLRVKSCSQAAIGLCEYVRNTYQIPLKKETAVSWKLTGSDDDTPMEVDKSGIALMNIDWNPQTKAVYLFTIKDFCGLVSNKTLYMVDMQLFCKHTCQKLRFSLVYCHSMQHYISSLVNP